jgi:hypothetical protein
MSHLSTHRFSFAGFAAALAITISLNGVMLIGFDQLATAQPSADGAAAQLVKSDDTAKQVTLERVVISGRRA